jgi:hypothetical protein
LGGLGVMVFAVAFVLVGWWAMGPSTLDVPDRTVHTTEEPEDATWEGVKVKKGLR